ncbi:MAG: TerB family tellurite resistance protein [Bauldia sp.]
MNLWQRFSKLLGDGVDAIGAVFDRVTSRVIGTPEERRQMAFSVALVALSAKMAKADGVVTFDEVAAFQRFVHYPVSQARNVERLFEIAHRDAAGYESYARRVASLYPPEDPILVDLIDGLFDIARADSMIHEAEVAYLADVARIVGLSEADFERIKARHVVPEEGDPYAILGVDRGLSFDALRRHYRRLVAEQHPDRLMAHGVPEEFIAIATQRLAVINDAWDRIEKERGRGE